METQKKKKKKKKKKKGREGKGIKKRAQRPHAWEAGEAK
eukprot:CAMPEP_0118851312 /NCGR_PEP_ID=MMETSP1163-20130328/802_1 /TAXON_ID=124430 /ORGANISM="Phaeomonas parva, Strain CCMP2877" /LENGTH=38 /DNA_ID= /DNA_START= /DNA_END= /DNA_ORIENTATION=